MGSEAPAAVDFGTLRACKNALGSKLERKSI